MGSVPRRWIQRLLAVAFGLLLAVGGLAGAEAVLRSTGRYAAPPPALPEAWGEGFRPILRPDHALLQVHEEDGRQVVRPRRFLVRDRIMQDVAFTPQAEPGVVRVFCFGGSATLGVPNEREPAKTFPGQLQALLDEAGVRAEVINLGGAAFGSDDVVRLAEEASAYDGDFWVVYSGNNEFNQYNQALLEANQDWASVAARLERLHLVRALRDLLGRPAPLPTQEAIRSQVAAQRAAVRAIMERTLDDPDQRPAFHDGLARRRDRHHEVVLHRYAANLARVARTGRAAGATVFFGVVPPNLLQEPWLSLNTPGLAGGTPAGWEAARDAARDAWSRGDFENAALLAGRWIEADPIHAAAWWLRGRARLRLGDIDGAATDLRNALALDMDPGRPLPGFDEAVEAAAREAGTEPVRFERWFGPHADPPFGEGLWADSCHMRPRGYAILARAFARAILGSLPQASP